MSWQHQSVIFLTKFKISFRHIPIGERVVFFFLRRKRLTLWETDQNTENRYLYFCFILLFFLLPSKRFNSIHNPQILPLLCGSPLRDSTNCFAFGSNVTSKSCFLILAEVIFHSLFVLIFFVFIFVLTLSLSVQSAFSLSVQTSEYASSLTVVRHWSLWSRFRFFFSQFVFRVWFYDFVFCLGFHYAIPLKNEVYLSLVTCEQFKLRRYKIMFELIIQLNWVDFFTFEMKYVWAHNTMYKFVWATTKIKNLPLY